MKKFECKECDSNCVVTSDRLSPGYCLYDKEEVDWQEVKEEEQKLPKLTAEVFDRPDCPSWARYAVVNADGSVRVFLNKPMHLCNIYWYDPTSYWKQQIELPGKYDASDWKNSMVKRPMKVLPNWVKVGAIGYDHMNDEYFEVIKVNNGSFRAKPIGSSDSCSGLYFNEFCSEARKRPFNAKEMRGLVGKVIENDNIALLVNSYGKLTGDIGTYSGRRTAEDLMDNGFVIDGKPCYVLEHLENGEWGE